jgi:hypothetical protein
MPGRMTPPPPRVGMAQLEGLDPSAPPVDPTVHLKDIQYFPQFCTDIAGVNIFIAGQPGDPTSNHVNAQMKNINGTVIFSQTATRMGVGLYQIQFTSQQTSIPGFYTIYWTFTVNTHVQTMQSYLEIGATNPEYTSLSTTLKTMVDRVWIRFSDIYDSPMGGPHLQTYFQSNFSRGRIAQLLIIAMGFLNTMAQPHSWYTASNFPVREWGFVLEQGTYVECLKHLIRSYVETPNPIGIETARMTRRDYMDRWGTILQGEEAMYKSQTDVFKIRHMFLSRPAVIVSGGVYMNFGPTRLPGSAAARPHYWRFAI